MFGAGLTFQGATEGGCTRSDEVVGVGLQILTLTLFLRSVVVEPRIQHPNITEQVDSLEGNQDSRYKSDYVAL